MKARTCVPAIFAVGLATASWSIAAKAAEAGLEVKPATDVQPRGTYLISYDASASSVIGSSVQNFLEEELGVIEDLIINSDGKVVHAVLSVGGFLGIGDKLVVVPYSDLLLVGNEQIYVDINKERLEAAPAFANAGQGVLAQKTTDMGPARDPLDRAVYERELSQRLEEWQAKLSEFKDKAASKADRAADETQAELEDAWDSVNGAWTDLKKATDEKWQEARVRLERAWNDLETEWQDATR